jgi:hypothetical protein
MKKNLHPYHNVFYTTYQDDVLIYSQTLEEHMQHVHQIISFLQQADLQVKQQKYKFHKITTEYLGRLVTPEGLRMDSGKVSALK